MLDRITSTSGSASTPQTQPRATSQESAVEKTDTKTKIEVEKPLSETEKEKVAKVVDGLNDFLTPSHTSLKFEYHEKLNEYYVTLVDDNTKEIVKEIPSKKMLDFYAAMTESIGLMIDKKI